MVRGASNVHKKRVLPRHYKKTEPRRDQQRVRSVCGRGEVKWEDGKGQDCHVLVDLERSALLQHFCTWLSQGPASFRWNIRRTYWIVRILGRSCKPRQHQVRIKQHRGVKHWSVDKHVPFKASTTFHTKKFIGSGPNCESIHFHSLIKTRPSRSMEPVVVVHTHYDYCSKIIKANRINKRCSFHPQGKSRSSQQGISLIQIPGFVVVEKKITGVKRGLSFNSSDHIPR